MIKFNYDKFAKTIKTERTRQFIDLGALSSNLQIYRVTCDNTSK